jgi:hypothetical protein
MTFNTAIGVATLLALVAGNVWLVLLVLRKRRVFRHGQALFAPLVQANRCLFQRGLDDAPAQALICFDSDSPELRRDLLEIAGRIGSLKLATSGALSPAEVDVAAIVQNETARMGKAAQLPVTFTDGRTVFAVSVWVKRKYLPERVLNRNFIYCRAQPEDPGFVWMIPDSMVSA